MSLKSQIKIFIFLLLGLMSFENAISAEIVDCHDKQNEALVVIKPEFIKWVGEISKNIPSQDLCETVEITNTQKIKNQSFTSFGQGSVFKSELEPKKLFVLTAAHVVANSDGLDIHCGDKTIHAKIRGISQTTDLAVLELDDNPKEFRPLFTWDGKKLPVAEVRHNLSVDNKDYLPKGAHYIQTSSNFVSPESLHLVRITENGEKVIPNRYLANTEIVTDSSDHPLVGSKTAMLLTSKGIRPGMSGSPILYSIFVPNWDAKNKDEQYIEKHFLSGVLVKTYVNETQSIAVPLATINNALPLLMKGDDPAKLPSSPYYFEKKLSLTDSGAIETPTIIFHTKNGDEEFQAACPGPFSNTSGKGGSGDSTGKGGSGDSTGKGGAGDSTGKGGSGDSTGKDGSVDSKFNQDNGYYNTGSVSLYRDHFGCKEIGIKDSKGNVYLAVTKEDGTISKIESIEDVSDLIQKYGEQFPNYLKEHGLKSGDTQEMYKQFCSNPEIFNKNGQPRKIRIERRDFDPENTDVAQFSSSSEMGNDESFYDVNLEVKCDPLAKLVKVRASKDGFKADLTIKPDSWGGTILFRGCQSTFSEVPKMPWSASHKDANLDLQVSISPDQSFLSFNIFAANQKCLTKTKSPGLIKISSEPNPPTEVWLSKIDLTLPKEKKLFDDFKEEQNTSEQNKKEEALLKADRELHDSGLEAISTDPKKAKKVLQALHQNELDELEKEIIGEPVSQERIFILRLMIKQLQTRLND